MANWLHRLGSFASARRGLVIAAWIVFAVAMIGLSRISGGGTVDDFRVPGVESQRAVDLLKERFPDGARTA